jgi:hypothetical protein
MQTPSVVHFATAACRLFEVPNVVPCEISNSLPTRICPRRCADCAEPSPLSPFSLLSPPHRSCNPAALPSTPALLPFKRCSPGPFAKVASLVAIVIGGYAFAHGEPAAKNAAAFSRTRSCCMHIVACRVMMPFSAQCTTVASWRPRGTASSMRTVATMSYPAHGKSRYALPAGLLPGYQTSLFCQQLRPALSHFYKVTHTPRSVQDWV